MPNSIISQEFGLLRNSGRNRFIRFVFIRDTVIRGLIPRFFTAGTWISSGKSARTGSFTPFWMAHRVKAAHIPRTKFPTGR